MNEMKDMKDKFNQKQYNFHQNNNFVRDSNSQEISENELYKLELNKQPKFTQKVLNKKQYKNEEGNRTDHEQGHDNLPNF